jgi:hypothetical protein
MGSMIPARSVIKMKIKKLFSFEKKDKIENELNLRLDMIN